MYDPIIGKRIQQCLDIAHSAMTQALALHKFDTAATSVKIPVGSVIEQPSLRIERTPMVNMTNTQQVTLGPIVVKNRRGGPATFDGAPQWASSDESILSLQPSEDGMSCTVIAFGGVGTASVVVTGDADLGGGVQAVTGQIDFNITPGEAQTIEIPEGTAEEIPGEPSGG